MNINKLIEEIQNKDTDSMIIKLNQMSKSFSAAAKLKLSHNENYLQLTNEISILSGHLKLLEGYNEYIDFVLGLQTYLDEGE